jgi:hypothetical protein
MAWRCSFMIAALTAGGAGAFSQVVTLTPTFNNIGIAVDLPSATTASVRVFIKNFGASTNDYREQHPLSRLTSTRFAGSVFGLTPAARYDVKLTSSAFASDQSVSATTRSDNFTNATNTTYHVSSISGNDANNGSSFALAFRTLAHALAVANSGAKILLYDGTYYEGDLSPPRSGTATAPIVIARRRLVEFEGIVKNRVCRAIRIHTFATINQTS